MGAPISRKKGNFGIYRDDRTPLPYADIVSETFIARPDPDVMIPPDSDTFAGPCLFAGQARNQFGHVLLNGLGRLWALRDLPPETTLIYTTKNAPNPARFPHIRTILDEIGIQNPFRIIKSSTRFTELYVANEQFGERFAGRGSADFYAWLDQQLPPAALSREDNKLYVSRTGLGPSAGRFACEAHLETLLAANGYEIFYPEQHSLTEQFARYEAAKQLIFAEGSALHAFALRRRPDQQVAVIQRRAALPGLIATQMNDRAGAPVLAINAVKEIFWPPIRSDHLSVAVIDFMHLRKVLVSNGFLSHDAQWTAPDDEVVKASLVAGISAEDRMLNASERDQFLRQLRQRRRKRQAQKSN